MTRDHSFCTATQLCAVIISRKPSHGRAREREGSEGGKKERREREREAVDKQEKVFLFLLAQLEGEPVPQGIRVAKKRSRREGGTREGQRGWRIR